MRNKRFVSLLLFFASTCSLLFAQTITVNGTVTDVSGTALPGVSILIKGTTTGTVTDFDGNYQLTASEGDVLIFSFLGFKKKEIVVSNSTLNVTLEEDAATLDEVVVTAFGIEKKEKSLGYSVTQVKAEDLNLAGQANAVEALQGRVAGLQINRTSGSSGGGVDILIRGVTSVNPERDNQPLIILDGIALNNDTFSGNVGPSKGSKSPSSSEQFAFSNRLGDINPEDIENFNVLKGAAATALYGLRAANGAIVITTKKGKIGKPKITFTASTSFRNLKTVPELQTTYREGWKGEPRTLYDPDSDTGFFRIPPTRTSFYSWGPRYSDDQWVDPKDPNNVVDLSDDRFYDPYELFKTGVNTQLNLSISGASEKLDYYFSMGNNQDEGILPNTRYDKTNFRFKGGYKLSDKFTINSSISYAKSGGVRANSGDKSVMSSLSYYSGTFDINDYQNPDGSQRNFSFGIIDNPRYFMEKSSLIDDVNRWVGNATFIYTPNNWLNISYSAQVDNYSDRRNRFVPPDLDVGTQVGGFIVNQNINFTGLESNLLVFITNNWSDDFNTSLTLGHQVSDTKRTYDEVRGETLNVSGINEMGNTINKFALSEVEQLRNVGVFGEVKMEYKDRLFLSITGRNDWVSVLSRKNRSFFYPSVSLAYDISKWFDGSDVFSFGKLRASWAEVGKGPLFGQIGHYFIVDGDFPFNGAGGYRSSTTLGDLNITPERNQSTEFGLDFRFFKNRLRLDYSYYKTRVKNQIFSVGTAFSSGIASTVRNAGDFEISGHEFLISVDIAKTKDFYWEIFGNYSTSKGKVLDLPDDIKAIIFANSGFAGVTSEVREGDQMGSLYGWKWRYENGQRYIADDGLPRIDFDARQKVGNAFPDFISSIGNNLKWKGVGFNFLLEYKKGGDVYDAGRRNSIRNGILKLTDFRDATTVLEGVTDDGNGGFIPNKQEVKITQDYYRNSTVYNRASEILVQDASWIKLRNIGLSYEINAGFMEKLNIERLSISVSANNILIWTPYDGFDPEGNQYSAGSNVYGFTGLNIPLSENYTFGINVGF